MVSRNETSGSLIADRRYEYAKALLADKDYEIALDLLLQTTELAPNWAPLWFTLGETYCQLGNPEKAIEAFRRVAALEPSDRLGAALRIAKITGVKIDQAMSPGYIAALFDQYAERFDTHLTRALQYQGPEILLAHLQQHCRKNNRNFHFDRAADLGCGTGLMAAKIWTAVDAIIGVDLSALMVERAQQSGFYSEVFCSDIVTYLAGAGSRSFDLLLAADVLVYVSDVAPIFTQAVRTMTADGLFAFTVQSFDGEGYQLGEDMRYHHSEQYLRQAAMAAGLKVEFVSKCVTRQDAGQPVPGFMVILGGKN